MVTNAKRQTVEMYIEEKRVQGEEPVCAYVYDLEKLRDHANTIKESLPDFCKLYYAVKANPDQHLLEVLAPTVDGFEVASEGEIHKVNEVGQIPMIFGAPAKKDCEIEAAIRAGVGYLNVESFQDLNRMLYLAEQKQVKIPILIRVNLSSDVPDSHHMMSGVPSQFGVDEADIPDLIEKALQSDHVKIEGFHFHAMSNNLNAKAHVRFVETCIEKSRKWQEQFKLQISVVDIGGGIGINYWSPGEPFDWDTFAEGIDHLGKIVGNLTLVLEIGRYMTAECGFYVTEVLDVKKNHDQYFSLVRGGSHHLRLPAAWKMSQPFRIHPVEEWRYPFERPEVLNADVTIAGELCTPNDVLVRRNSVKQLRAGDIIIFEMAGAYAWTISHHDFLSHPQPEMVYLNE
ncbi:type III PLP-dependent enzyme [Halobacillus sp. H74]|uniref:type III PLP-dependent enzyme n=1 Tax=Halobacillus sp. H74 TaxID=3457436 RepID=UPI003FCC5485